MSGWGRAGAHAAMQPSAEAGPLCSAPSGRLAHRAARARASLQVSGASGALPVRQRVAAGVAVAETVVLLAKRPPQQASACRAGLPPSNRLCRAC